MYGAPNIPCWDCNHTGTYNPITPYAGHLLQIDGSRPCQVPKCRCSNFTYKHKHSCPRCKAPNTFCSTLTLNGIRISKPIFSTEPGNGKLELCCDCYELEREINDCNDGFCPPNHVHVGNKVNICE